MHKIACDGCFTCDARRLLVFSPALKHNRFDRNLEPPPLACMAQPYFASTLLDAEMTELQYGICNVGQARALASPLASTFACACGPLPNSQPNCTAMRTMVNGAKTAASQHSVDMQPLFVQISLQLPLHC